MREAIRSADIVAREALARVLERYGEDFPDEYCFALTASAPALLRELFFAILDGSDPDEEQAEKDRAKRRRQIRIVPLVQKGQ